MRLAPGIIQKLLYSNSNPRRRLPHGKRIYIMSAETRPASLGESGPVRGEGADTPQAEMLIATLTA
jgi:hypothetical protein